MAGARIIWDEVQFNPEGGGRFRMTVPVEGNLGTSGERYLQEKPETQADQKPGDAWGDVKYANFRIIVSRVGQGSEEALRRHLDACVAQVNERADEQRQRHAADASGAQQQRQSQGRAAEDMRQNIQRPA
jgi:hypothetical protein